MGEIPQLKQTSDNILKNNDNKHTKKKPFQKRERKLNKKLEVKKIERRR